MSDPTDPGGVGAAQAERVSRTTTRVGDSGSPVGSPLTIVLAVVAVVVGFLIFRSIDDNGTSAGGPGPETPTETSTTVAGGPTPTPPPGGATTLPTPAGRVTAGADVIVINASEKGGTAQSISDLLGGVEYSMITPASDDDEVNPGAEATTSVFYAEGTAGDAARLVAASIANDLGLPADAVKPKPADGPAVDSDSTLGSATVFVFLGEDKADLTALAPAAPQTPTTPAPTTTAP